MVVFPSSLTEEEEALQKKYAKLKKKKKALLALKKQNSTNQTNQSGLKRTLSDQPVVDTATATEQAKMLIKTGAISAIKSENKNSGFKRSRMLEKKDPEKGQNPAFLPFQRSVSTDEEPLEAGKRSRRPLYESFVSSRDRFREEEEGGSVPPSRSDSYPERRGVRKGNTVYVYGSGLGEDSLRSSFSPHGTIIDLSMDNPRNCAFITFEKMESADQAVAELNGTTVGDVHVKVSIARKQPMLDAATGKSVWASLAVQNSTKGSYRDKRNQVVYSEDFL
ncbi:Negative elongation factor E [Dissostichus eleginoides]|uniref:Negative elongation factor E n=1 Tax=Dissostichus eleginoides TaxID=100907 RepID=A0AAD9BC03_DISEL|nr:Negative elongation factor E [Dissostichus eleginoides]